MNTYITDLFGNSNINDNIVILLLQTSDYRTFLTQIAKTDNDSIWCVDQNKYKNFMLERSLEPQKYIPIEHLWFTNDEPKTLDLLIISKSILHHPKDYDIAGTYGKGFVWKPIGKYGYKQIAFYYSENKPKLSDTYLINEKYLTDYNGRFYSVDNVTNLNEFHLLGTIDIPRITLDRTKLFNSSGGFDVTHDITGTSFELSAKGELKSGNDCVGVLTVNRNDNATYLQECDQSQPQKWYPDKTGGISSAYTGECLTIDNQGSMIVEKCDKTNKKHKWGIKRRSPWKTKKGKRTVLVESNDPWYINDDNAIELDSTPIDHSEMNGYRDNADYKPFFKPDLCKKDVGLGHSFKSRHLATERALKEGFSKKRHNKIHISKLLFFLTWLILILCVIHNDD